MNVFYSKRQQLKLVFMMFFAFLLVSCSKSSKQETTEPSAPVTQQNLRDFAYSLKTQSACEAENGRWQKVGRLQQAACILPTSDAGKACKNKAECQVACVINGTNVVADTPVTGQCHDSTHLFGCRTYVNNGVVEHTLCID